MVNSSISAKIVGVEQKRKRDLGKSPTAPAPMAGVNSVAQQRDSATPYFVLQAAKLYHKEQSQVIVMLSVYWMIFVINLPILLFAS
jgi:hypothetical protein